MPKAQTSDIYPSLVNLTTDENGDLAETLGSPSLPASTILYEGTSGAVTIQAAENGVAGNLISVNVVDNNGGVDKAEYEELFDNNGNSIGKEINVLFADPFTAAFGGTYDEAIYNTGITLTAVAIGDLGDKLQFSVIDNVAGATQDEVKVSATDNDVTVCLQNDRTAYTNDDIWDLLTNTAYAWVAPLSTVMTPSQNANYVGTDVAINVALTLQGGVDPSGQDPAQGTAKIVSLINNTAETSAIVSASGGDTSLPSTVNAQALTGGVDYITSDLDFNASYICINIEDIHSLLESEVFDARKILWGMLETYVQFVTGQSAEQQPENLIVTRGAPTLLNDNAGVRIRQTYTLNAFYGVGDFDLEDETDAN